MNRELLKRVSIMLVFAVLFSFVFSIGSSQISYAVTGDGSWSYPYSVSQAIANQYSSVKTVQGYVVGQPTAANTVITSGFPNDYAIALADVAGERDTNKMIYVQISSTYRYSFGLWSNPSLMGKQVKVTGSLSSYFSPHAGVKNITRIEKVLSATPTVTPTPTPKPSVTPTPTPKPSVTPTPSPTDSYYTNAIGKSGTELKKALHEIIDDHTELSYDAVWSALRDTDEDPRNSNNVILIYTGRSQGKYTNGAGVNNWNREHVWAKSHGDFGTAAGAGTDLHHLRPADVSVNSTRGNKDFDYGGTYDSEATLCKTDADSWEPRDAVKGDVARMLFYMAVRYEGDSGEVNLELSNSNYTGSTAPYHGKLSVLLEWNKMDPVDDMERRRNEIIYSRYQGNRNPFIDHPEWVDLIWK